MDSKKVLGSNPSPSWGPSALSFYVLSVPAWTFTSLPNAVQRHTCYVNWCILLFFSVLDLW